MGNGYIAVWPQGSANPGVSTLNFVAGRAIANAAIVSAGTGGGISVLAAGSGTALIIDINGYFDDTRTRTVRPVGTQAQNGAALLSALANITTASALNPFLLKLQPGIYDIGASTLSMKPHVDIEGSGELSTTITSSGGANAITVSGADSTEIRFLTLNASSAGSNFAIGYYLQSATSRLTHVAIATTETGPGGAGIGISVTNGAALTTDHVTVSAIAPIGQSEGLQCLGSTVFIQNSAFSASGGSLQSNGVLNDSCTVNLQNSVVSATGAPNNLGIVGNALHGGSTVNVDASQITGSTNTINNSSLDITFVGASKLVGGPVVGGTAICAGVYNGSYTFFASICP